MIKHSIMNNFMNRNVEKNRLPVCGEAWHSNEHFFDFFLIFINNALTQLEINTFLNRVAFS